MHCDSSHYQTVSYYCILLLKVISVWLYWVLNMICNAAFRFFVRCFVGVFSSCFLFTFPLCSRPHRVFYKASLSCVCMCMCSCFHPCFTPDFDSNGVEGKLHHIPFYPSPPVHLTCLNQQHLSVPSAVSPPHLSLPSPVWTNSTCLCPHLSLLLTCLTSKPVTTLTCLYSSPVSPPHLSHFLTCLYPHLSHLLTCLYPHLSHLLICL